MMAKDMAESKKEGVEEDVRVVLRLPAIVSPVQVAVLPLTKKLAEPAEKICRDLRRFFRCEFDVTGSIGKRYRRQDEIGTPFAITVDYDTKEDKTVTIRDRDSMKQVRIPIDRVPATVCALVDGSLKFASLES